MADTPFPSFTTSATPLATEYAVGYSTNVSGGERRWLWSDLRTLMQANLGTAAFVATSTLEPAIAAGTTAQYWRGDKSWQTLDKTAVGLGNVENTALSTWPGSSNLTTLGTITPRLLIQQSATDTYYTDGLTITGQNSGDSWGIAVSSTGVLNFGRAVSAGGAYGTRLSVGVGGVITTVNTTDASSTVSGSVIIPGGVGIAKSLYAVGINGTTFNGNTLTAGAYVLTGAAGKTLTFSNTLTLAGTDGTTMTFPATTATLARIDAANAFVGASTGTSWTLTTPVIAGGLTASGAGSITFVGSTATFITSTGANTLSGAVTINAAATPSITTASGKTNTGFLQINGKTSGALKFITADATAQTITVTGAAQTVGTTTLTIPDFASVSDTFVFVTLAQTLSNKTFVSPILGTPASGTVTNLTGTASININGTVGATTPGTGAFTTLSATTSLAVGVASPNLMVEILGTAATANPSYAGSRVSADASGSGLLCVKARGTTGSPDFPSAADVLCTIGGGGWNGTTLYTYNKATILLRAFNTWVAGGTPDNSTDISFQTTPAASVTRAEVFRLASAQITALAPLSLKVSSASNATLIDVLTTFTTYGCVSLNNTKTIGGILGIYGGDSGDGNLYLNAPSGWSVKINVNNGLIGTFAATGLTVGGSVTTSAPTTGTAGAWKLGILVTTATVFDTTRYIQLDVGGVLYKLAVCT